MQPADVLEYWFEDACLSPEAARAREPFWFQADPATDSEIWQQFADAVQDAAQGVYDYWEESAEGRLALIILLDQFPRNMFRGTSEVYRYDSQALSLADQGVTLGQLAELAVPAKAFFLMPYQHAEDLAVQQAGVKLMAAVVDAAPEEWRDVAKGYYDFARRHHDIVAEYGRFPHRNSLLGRSSTEAETRFLESGGETFGQSA